MELSIILSILMFLMVRPPHVEQEMMERLVPVPGERPNSFVYYHEGYCYHQCTANHRIFRCSTRSRTRCSGRVYTIDDELTVDRRRNIPHTCESQDLVYLQKAEFKRELYERCRRGDEDFIQIYEELITEERHRQAAEALGFNDLRPTMRNHRAREVPPTPQTLLQLADRILNFAPIVRYYSGFVRGPEESTALIFVNPDLMEGLMNPRCLYGDGTFKIRPTDPRDIAQVYTLHITEFGVGFPPILCLMTRRITGLYEAMLRYIIDRVPNLRNLEMFHTDFERAAINAIIRVLPNVRIGGCFFHYSQAIVKFWRRQLRMGNRIEENRHLALLLALPFLRPADMENALGQIALSMIAQRIPNSDRLVRYWRRMWLPITHIITVFQRRIRTNNVSEAFHKQAERLIGPHQTLWRFLGRMSRMMHRDGVYYNAVLNGHVRPVRDQNLINFNRWLDNNEHRYNEDGPFRYLEMVAVQRDRLHFNQFVNNVNLEDEVIMNEQQHEAFINGLHGNPEENEPLLANIMEREADVEIHNNENRNNARGGQRGPGRRARGGRRGRGGRGAQQNGQRDDNVRRGGQAARRARGRGENRRQRQEQEAAEDNVVAVEAPEQPVMVAARAANQRARELFRNNFVNQQQNVPEQRHEEQIQRNHEDVEEIVENVPVFEENEPQQQQEPQDQSVEDMGNDLPAHVDHLENEPRLEQVAEDAEIVDELDPEVEEPSRNNLPEREEIPVNEQVMEELLENDRLNDALIVDEESQEMPIENFLEQDNDSASVLAADRETPIVEPEQSIEGSSRQDHAIPVQQQLRRRTGTALRYAVMRKRRQAQSNPGMLSKKRKRRQNNKKKIEHLVRVVERVNDENSAVRANLQTLNHEVVEFQARIDEYEDKVNELDTTLAARNVELAEVQQTLIRHGAFCCCCLINVPTYRVIECSHVIACDDCLLQLVQITPRIDRNRGIRCPRCNEYGFPERIFII